MQSASRLALIAGVAAIGLTGLPAAQAQETLRLWSHWADHETKVAFVEQAVKNFEAKHPGTEVEITWYQKPPLYAALKTALVAGQAPDVFYSEPDQVEYIENGFLLPLDEGIDWNNVEDWSRDVWTFDGKTYGLPLETFTVELYYNKDTMKQLGFELPEGGQVDQAQFKEIVKAAADAGITPIVQGVGDRPYPGAYLTHELLLKKLGADDYGKLLNGQLSFTDPRVAEVFTYVKEPGRSSRKLRRPQGADTISQR
jgi:multiple sugar transport system substrate-binding protein